MSQKFDKAIEFVLKWEGGYVHDMDDPGGETNWGISKRAYPDVDIYSLTKNSAKEIYRRDYWDRCQCDRMNDGVALMVFDEAVNQGIKAASMDLQLSVRVRADGIIGPKTLQALNGLDSKRVITDMSRWRIERYKDLVLHKPEMRHFLAGWINRANACRDEALKGD